MRAQQMPDTPARPPPGSVLVSMIVLVLAVLVLAVAGGARMRVAHNAEGARKNASQHVGNSQPGAAATRSQGDPGLDGRSGCYPAGRRYAHRVRELLVVW